MFVLGHLPWKVEKAYLMQIFGLPLDETYIFSGDELVDETNKVISSGLSILESHPTIVFRSAYNPDRFGTQWFIASSKSKLEEVVESLVELARSSKELSHVLLHSDLTDPSRKNDMDNFLSGKYMLLPDSELPLEETLEFVNRQYYAWLMDQRDFRPFGEDYTLIQRRLGRTRWEAVHGAEMYNEHELAKLKIRFHHLRPAIGALREFVAQRRGKSLHHSFITVDFIQEKSPGNRFVTYDFDYGIQGRKLY